jgi:hypothetical protein
MARRRPGPARGNGKAGWFGYASLPPNWVICSSRTSRMRAMFSGGMTEQGVLISGRYELQTLLCRLFTNSHLLCISEWRRLECCGQGIRPRRFVTGTSFIWVSRCRETKRPPGNGVASSSRENSSNGGFKTVKTFWRNLMSRKLGCQENFLEINPLFSVD